MFRVDQLKSQLLIMFLRKVFSGNWRYYLVLSLFPFLNKSIGYGKTTEHILLSCGLGILYLSLIFLMLGTFFWISYVAKAYTRYTESMQIPHTLMRYLYYPICLAPGLLVLLIFVTHSFLFTPPLPDILYYKAKNRFWVYIFVAGVFAYWRLRLERQRYETLSSPSMVDAPEVLEAEVLPNTEAAPRMYIVAAGKEEMQEVLKDVIEPIVHDAINKRRQSEAVEEDLEKEDYLFVFYPRLILHKRGPVYNHLGAIRFFDIVLVRLRSKGGDIYLIDGTCIPCCDIQKTLRDLGLFYWMVRIHKSVLVNMMHVNYDQYRDGGYLVLQSGTMARMTERRLKRRDILILLKFGSNIGTSCVDRFIANRASLTYEVWDTFVPVKRKIIPDNKPDQQGKGTREKGNLS